jgi:thiosulfate/3-mercaptopyruvate sulfurtransferase
MWHRSVLALVVPAVLISLGAGCAEARTPVASTGLTPLVSTEWLARNLQDPSLVLLHVGMKEGYEKGHIPGARLASMRKMIAFGPDSLRDEMPPVSELTSALGALGIANDSRVVICFDDARFVTVAARAFVTFEYLGMQGRVAVLDGGLPKWTAEKRALSREAASTTPSRFEPVMRGDVIVNGDWVAANLRNAGVTLVDVRPPASYDGREKFDHGPRSGHIPGAINIPVSAVMADKPDYVMKSVKQLEQVFREAGVRDGSTVVAYCGTGLWASTVYLVSRHLGHATRLYDASFQEWSKNERYPVVAPVDPGAVR